MSEPTKITIEVSELQALLAAAEEGLNPKVEYHPGEDRRMLDDAYEKRGVKLLYIADRLRSLRLSSL